MTHPQIILKRLASLASLKLFEFQESAKRCNARRVRLKKASGGAYAVTRFCLCELNNRS